VRFARMIESDIPKWKLEFTQQVKINEDYLEKFLLELRWISLERWGPFLNALTQEDCHDTMRIAALRLLRRMQRSGYILPEEKVTRETVAIPIEQLEELYVRV